MDRQQYRVIKEGFFVIWISNDDSVSLTKGDVFDVSKSGYDSYLRFRHSNNNGSIDMGLMGITQLNDGIENNIWELVE